MFQLHMTLEWDSQELAIHHQQLAAFSRDHDGNPIADSVRDFCVVGGNVCAERAMGCVSLRDHRIQVALMWVM